MNDTDVKTQNLFNAMIMSKSGQERLAMGFSMFNMARKQVIASIRQDNPYADAMEIKRDIFLRFYGHDFSPEEQKKILKRLLL
ncbi:MAG: hypothetical protein A2132_07035 [Nitrospirae bacterium RBG_16_43_11]|nr:MAG: hypothetical protein A2132_07035 [Nitrospirae bacterium RBG_16_43_11]